MAQHDAAAPAGAAAGLAERDMGLDLGDHSTTTGHYLKVLMDEVFGRNFVINVIWQKTFSPTDAHWFQQLPACRPAFWFYARDAIR